MHNFAAIRFQDVDNGLFYFALARIPIQKNFSQKALDSHIAIKCEKMIQLLLDKSRCDILVSTVKHDDWQQSETFCFQLRRILR